MSFILLIDLGSTFTKLTLVDTLKQKIIATSSSNTTTNNVVDGLNNALNNMEQKLNIKVTYDKAYASSSAKGGLKMAAIGLIDSLTTKAAKEACLGAGAKLELVFSNKLSKDDIKLLESKDIDIILLAGGTDGGNQEVGLYNAEKLANSNLSIPFIYAGNKSIKDDISDIFNNFNKEIYLVDNIMPKLNVLNIDMAKQKIHEIFIDKIVSAKGINTIVPYLSASLYPTPSAVLMAAELLSVGTNNHTGLGDLMIVDIGGATTDVYSVGYGLPKKENVVVTGLEEPFAKRTVEGDLGMRISASGFIPFLTNKEKDDAIKKYSILKETQKREKDISFVPVTDIDKEIDSYIALNCAKIALLRHIGTITPNYTYYGTVYEQIGKDLTDVKYVITTGGTLIYNEKSNFENVLNYQNPTILAPKDPKLIKDDLYIISAMGLLSLEYPDLALKILKDNLLKGE